MLPKREAGWATASPDDPGAQRPLGLSALVTGPLISTSLRVAFESSCRALPQ